MLIRICFPQTTPADLTPGIRQGQHTPDHSSSQKSSHQAQVTVVGQKPGHFLRPPCWNENATPVGIEQPLPEEWNVPGAWKPLPGFGFRYTLGESQLCLSRAPWLWTPRLIILQSQFPHRKNRNKNKTLDFFNDQVGEAYKLLSTAYGPLSTLNRMPLTRVVVAVVSVFTHYIGSVIESKRWRNIALTDRRFRFQFYSFIIHLSTYQPTCLFIIHR